MNRAAPLRILHTNDFHGVLPPSKLERLAELREHADVYFDSGDAVKAGNLSFALKPESIWQGLHRLQCDASVTGNRECHLYEFAVRLKLNGARHPILCGNLRRLRGEYLLPRSIVLERAGWKVGIVSAMVPMVTPKMASQKAATLTWEPVLSTIQDLVDEIRSQVDVVIGLTHVGHRVDQQLAEKVSGLNIILGGHSHTVLQCPVQVGNAWIAQGGSHGRFAGVYEWNGEQLSGELSPLP